MKQKTLQDIKGSVLEAIYREYPYRFEDTGIGTTESIAELLNLFKTPLRFRYDKLFFSDEIMGLFEEKDLNDCGIFYNQKGIEQYDGFWICINSESEHYNKSVSEHYGCCKSKHYDRVESAHYDESVSLHSGHTFSKHIDKCESEHYGYSVSKHWGQSESVHYGDSISEHYEGAESRHYEDSKSKHLGRTISEHYDNSFSEHTGNTLPMCFEGDSMGVVDELNWATFINGKAVVKEIITGFVYIGSRTKTTKIN